MRLDYQKELYHHFFNSNGLWIREYTSNTPGHYLFTTHWHKYIEFLYITSGTLNCQIGNTQTAFHQGDVVIFSPLTPHGGIVGDDGVTYSTILFDPTNFLNELPIMEKRLLPIIENTISFVPKTNNQSVVNIIKDILNPQYNNANSMMQIAKTYELIEMLYIHCLDENITLQTNKPKLHAIREYIDAHFCENISTANLSRQFGYSEEHFCRIFKADTGLAPMNYIRILRLEKAADILRHDKRPLSVIAQECGFNSIQYFTQSFKNHYKLTPTDYIKKHMQRSNT